MKTVYGFFMREDAVAITPTHEEHDTAPAQDEDELDGRVVSLTRAQKLLGDLSYREVGLLCSRGELQSIKYGRRRLVVLASIDRYLNAKFEATGISLADLPVLSRTERTAAADLVRRSRAVAA